MVVTVTFRGKKWLLIVVLCWIRILDFEFATTNWAIVLYCWEECGLAPSCKGNEPETSGPHVGLCSSSLSAMEDSLHDVGWNGPTQLIFPSVWDRAAKSAQCMLSLG